MAVLESQSVPVVFFRGGTPPQRIYSLLFRLAVKSSTLFSFSEANWQVAPLGPIENKPSMSSLGPGFHTSLKDPSSGLVSATLP